MRIRLAALSAACCLLSIGCAEAQPETPPVAAASNCKGAVTRPQLVGSWYEDDPSNVATLLDDGTLKFSGRDAVGNWEYTKRSDTPAVPNQGYDDACVLWLEMTPLDLVYSVESVSERSVELIYLARGNTLVWKRADTT